MFCRVLQRVRHIQLPADILNVKRRVACRQIRIDEMTSQSRRAGTRKHGDLVIVEICCVEISTAGGSCNGETFVNSPVR